MPPLYFEASSGKLHNVTTEAALIPDGALPLGELLVAKEFPYVHGDFPTKPIYAWDKELVKKRARLVSEDLANLDPPAELTFKIVRRLFRLGLLPSHQYFEGKGDYTSFREFKQQLHIDTVTSQESRPEKNLDSVLKSSPIEFEGLSPQDVTHEAALALLRHCLPSVRLPELPKIISHRTIRDIARYIAKNNKVHSKDVMEEARRIGVYDTLWPVKVPIVLPADRNYIISKMDNT